MRDSASGGSDFRYAALVRRGTRAGDETSMAAKDQFFQQIHDTLAQVAKGELRNSLAAFAAFAGHGAGNLQRLRQRGIDEYVNESRFAHLRRGGAEPLQAARSEPRLLRGRQSGAAQRDLGGEPQQYVQLVLQALQLVHQRRRLILERLRDSNLVDRGFGAQQLLVVRVQPGNRQALGQLAGQPDE